MKVEIQLQQASQRLVYDNVVNAYTKGDMYCLLIEVAGERHVDKFPLCSIFRVRESYT